MVLILNMMSSDSLKKWSGKQKALHSFFVGIIFYKYWKKKTKSKEKNQLIYKIDCFAIDFLLNIE